MDYIIHHFTEKSIKIKIIGSDADNCYRKRFDSQFQFIKSLWNDNVININQIPDNIVLYSNDVFHCLKRLRKRMINNGPLYLRPSDIQGKCFVDNYSLQSIDDTLPDCIFKKGSMISMDDYYPAALFKWSTLEKSTKKVMIQRLFIFGLEYSQESQFQIRIFQGNKDALCALWLYLLFYITKHF